MGIYLNPSNILLKKDRNNPIYVDKSLLIAELNDLIGTSSNFLCLSRPRRFGKSMAGNMIAAYYSKGCDSRALFSDLKIAQHPSFQQYLNKINVIKFDIFALFVSANDKNPIRLLFRRIVTVFAKQLTAAATSSCSTTTATSSSSASTTTPRPKSTPCRISDCRL